MDSTSIQYADARDWQDIMKNRSRLKMHELIERLGLRAKWSSNKRGKTNFDSPLVKELVNDMTNIVSTLPKETDELIAFLATPGSLKSGVEQLLNKHGSAIWGRMGDREHLVSVGEAEVEAFYYPRDLYFENDEDRELIRKLLHWWIGLKACNVILARERLDRERRKKEERLRARDDQAGPREPHPTVAIAPAFSSETMARVAAAKSEGMAASYSQPPRHVQALRLDTSYSNPSSPMSGTPPQSNDSPIFSAQGTGPSLYARDANGSRRPSALSQAVSQYAGVDAHPTRHTSTPPLPSMHQLSSELSNLVSNFPDGGSTASSRHQHTPSPAPASGAVPGQGGNEDKQQGGSGLDVETLDAFRRYIYPGDSGPMPAQDEDALLRRLETVWREKVRSRHKQSLEDVHEILLFAARDRAFLTWIELRRHLGDLDRVGQRWRQEAQTSEEINARVAQHKTLMSASRELVRSWEDIGQGLVVDWALEGQTADDLLVQAFVLVAGDEADGKLLWAPMDVAATVVWLKEHLEQFALEEAERGEGLLYVRTE